jgi:hypothetical protein
MHTREKFFNKFLSVTCCDTCTLSKCLTKKAIDKVVANNIEKLGLRRRKKSEPRRQQMPNEQ